MPLEGSCPRQRLLCLDIHSLGIFRGKRKNKGKKENRDFIRAPCFCSDKQERRDLGCHRKEQQRPRKTSNPARQDVGYLGQVTKQVFRIRSLSMVGDCACTSVCEGRRDKAWTHDLREEAGTGHFSLREERWGLDLWV